MVDVDYDQIDRRFNRLEDQLTAHERRLSRAERHLEDHDEQITYLRSVPETVAGLIEQMKNMREDLSEYASQAAQDRADASARDKARIKQTEDDRRDRRQTVQWVIGLMVAALIGLVAAAATIFASVPH